MLATEDAFPWGAVILFTILLTTLFTTMIALASKVLPRWYRRRDMPVVEEDYGKVSKDGHTQTEDEGRFILLSDASTQALDWQSFSNDELHDEIAFRLSNHHFAMSSRHEVPLVRCYDRKDTYKAWGATYNADAKQWYFPPGSDLRGLLQYHSDWPQNPELLRREILMRMIREIEHNPTLVR